MAFGEDVPVHAPMVAVPVTGLGGGFGGAVDAGILLDIDLMVEMILVIPNSSSLELNWGT